PHRVLAKWLRQVAPAALTGGRAFFFLDLFRAASMSRPIEAATVFLAIYAESASCRGPFKRTQLLAKTKPRVIPVMFQSPEDSARHRPDQSAMKHLTTPRWRASYRPSSA